MDDSASAPPRAGKTIANTLAHGVVLVGACVFLAVVIPHYEVALAQMGTKLPWITIVTLRLSQFMRSHWYLAAPVVAGLLCLDGLVYHALRKSGPKSAPAVWSALVVLAEAVVVVLLALSVYLPAVSMVEAME